MTDNSSLSTPHSSLIRVLLIEDNPGDARLIRENLADSGVARFEVTTVGRLSQGLTQLREAAFDVLLLDLSLPDSQGFDTFTTTLGQGSDVPIVVLTGLGDETLAVRAVAEGAQDYLLKGSMDAALLGRALRYAVERHRLRRELEETNRQLDFRVRELTSLNRLFQEHLSQRFAVIEAYREVVEGLRELDDKTKALAERAEAQQLPDLRDILGLDAGAGGPHASEGP